MNKTEKQFKKDFETKIEKKDINLTFDTTQLTPNTKAVHGRSPYKKPIIIGVSVLAGLAVNVALIAPIASIFFKIDENSVRKKKKRLSFNEIAIAENNSFRKLNSVSYPELSRPENAEISEEERSAYNNFSNLTYHALVDTSKVDNMSYSPVGLYSNLNELEYASSRESLTDRFNELLGLSQAERKTFYRKIMRANSYVLNEENTENSTQIKNAAFFNDHFGYSQNYVDFLTGLYCEAYQLDFDTQADKIVEWVGEAVGNPEYINPDFLEIDDDTELFLMSTLFFQNKWRGKYVEQNNIKDQFYLADGSSVTRTFMKHSYFITKYYDYDSYISFTDSYFGGNTITYIIPKSIDDNIYDLTASADIFTEDESKEVRGLPLNEGEDPKYFKDIMINLQMPKFTNRSDVDFKPALSSLGFSDMFDVEYDSFYNAFAGYDNTVYHSYMQKIKQRNEVDFSEDGTVVKSLSMAEIGIKPLSSSGIRINEVLDIKLNHPFIYIIRDINKNPIFVGHVDNPRQK